MEHGPVDGVPLLTAEDIVGQKEGRAVRSMWTLSCVLALAIACKSPAEPTAPPTQAPNTLSPAEVAAGWRLLFDGNSTAGWRGYRAIGIAGWQVINGELTRVSNGGDIITEPQFENFELALDWKVPPKGNSGVFFRATEDHEAIYHGAPEMQILDNGGHPDGQSPLTSAGANYALHAPAMDVTKPVGEWNTARLIVNGNHVEHWLNGVRVVAYELGTPEWQKLVAESPFKDWPAYGKATRGHIGLQDHGDRVAFRNIKIRVF